MVAWSHERLRRSIMNINKFDTEEKAKVYLNKLRYAYVENIGLSKDKCLLYRQRNSRRKALLTCKFDYLNKHSMDMGLVWSVQRF